ncbi:hypothetical protein ACWFRM_07620 [Streptomyces sp. NPDC055144]
MRRSGYTNIDLDAGWNATWDWQSRLDANGILMFHPVAGPAVLGAVLPPGALAVWHRQ